MLNRRILRIKAFKVLFSSFLSEKAPLSEAQAHLELSCEATRDLYLFMLGVVSPLTEVAKERAEAVKNKLNPTEEDKNYSTKFANNELASILEKDVDFQKIYKSKKFTWAPYDLYIRRTLTSISQSEYYMDYIKSETNSLEQDCKLFVKIFEQEFVDSKELEAILEELSIYWNDDLAYSLTYVCKSVKEIGKTGRWSMPLLYQSDMKEGADSDKAFVHKLLQSAYVCYDKYSEMITEAVPNWDKERIVSTDLSLIVMGMAEMTNFPEIPVKVSMNEYVEISKFYGTKKSRAFVNGLLDKMTAKLIEDGSVNKTGKGLL